MLIKVNLAMNAGQSLHKMKKRLEATRKTNTYNQNEAVKIFGTQKLTPNEEKRSKNNQLSWCERIVEHGQLVMLFRGATDRKTWKLMIAQVLKGHRI